jgi:membrane dipeptidase
MKPIIDAHLDLSWNAMSYDRDQLLPVAELRRLEQKMTGPSRGRCTVSLPAMREGAIGVCLATLLCRAMPEGVLPELDKHMSDLGARTRGLIILREDLDHANQTIACAAAQGQLAYYRILQEQGHLQMIRDAKALDDAWQQWANGPSADAPIGFILSMEGCDPIIEPEHAQWWYDQGLRTACLAHYGPSAYAMGTGADGPLTEKGKQLVKEFDRLGIILDLVHTADTAVQQALDLYSRPVFVSHGNCRALVDHDRQFSDQQINQIAQRGGVFGVVLDCWMLESGYTVGKGSHETNPSLEAVADHIDHICQITGSRDHVGIGSDLDGGFGTEESPCDLDTITNLQKLAPILTDRGYSDDDINAVFFGNWLRFFRESLPST